MLERDRTGIVVGRVPGEYDSLVWTPFPQRERTAGDHVARLDPGASGAPPCRRFDCVLRRGKEEACCEKAHQVREGRFEFDLNGKLTYRTGAPQQTGGCRPAVIASPLAM